ncbi:hypothetical protein H0I76_13015 [Limibaculum sp. M0105]|uniref:Lipoprotein n=1 Tax=Thermohalobaculum xanthum TaxID=2753746 RepID=A0A8J7M9B8_9RHOB|nr:hypothetical protein [Thermohalobaculum xanthum]MBK0400113.1 hypothetical protein [Thermohalobaculum xanthum]
MALKSMASLRGLLAASLVGALAFAQAHPVTAASIEHPVMSQYSMPEPLPFRAKQEEIDQLDADTKALVDQLRAGSPSAVAYAERAHGVLIFPRVETSNYFLLGETKAFGVLYVKDDAGKYEKSGYYFGERNALGFSLGKQTSSRVFMFMKEKTLEEFLAGDVTASYLVVDPETGETAGEPDADVALFITNVEGDVSEMSFKGLMIVPVSFIE